MATRNFAEDGPNNAGADWWMATAGVLLMAADILDGSNRNWSDGEQLRARAVLDEVLCAAQRGGFRQADILRTRLSLGRVDGYTLAMLQTAIAAAGATAIRDMWESSPAVAFHK